MNFLIWQIFLLKLRIISCIYDLPKLPETCIQGRPAEKSANQPANFLVFYLF